MNVKVKMTLKEKINEFLTKPSLICAYFGITAVVFVTTSLIVWLPSYFQNTRGIPQDKAGTLASAVMGMAIIGAPLGGYLADYWRKINLKARLLFPTFSTLIAAILLFTALYLFTGIIQFVTFLIMGIVITAFISAAVSVTQDVIHPGLRAISYSIAVVIQNLLGASMAPIVIGKIYDLTNIKTAFSILPFILIVGSVLFFIGSRYYLKDLEKVIKVELEVEK